MKKPLKICFDPVDWYKETKFLNANEKGVYVSIIMFMLEIQKPIKSNPEYLARVCNTRKTSVQKSLSSLLYFDLFEEKDGVLWCDKIQEIIAKAEARRDKAKKAATTRWEKVPSKTPENRDIVHAKIQNEHYLTKIEHKETDVLEKVPLESPEIKDIGHAKTENEHCSESDPSRACNNIYNINNNILKNKKNNNINIITKKTKKSESEEVEKNKAVRLPEDFKPDMAIAYAEGFTETQAKKLFANFKDYWNAKQGKKGTKKDWPSTWRNWVRNPYSASFKIDIGSRIPEKYKPDLNVALKEGFDIDQAESLAKQFVSHYLAASGNNALRSNWGEAWKNWVLSPISHQMKKGNQNNAISTVTGNNINCEYKNNKSLAEDPQYNKYMALFNSGDRQRLSS